MIHIRFLRLPQISFTVMTDPDLSKMYEELPNDILKARERIQPFVRNTQLMHSPFLSKTGDCYIKMGKLGGKFEAK